MPDPPILGPYPTALANGGMPPTPPEQGGDPLADRKREITRVYAPLIRSLRDRRRATIDVQWALNLDCWKAVHRHPGFRGEWFNHYIPAARQKIENFIKKATRQLWPSPDNIEVYPAAEGDPGAGAQAEAIKNYLTWRLWRCRFRSQTAQLLRCLALYQRAIVKSSLDMRDVPGQIWPSVRTVDPWAFYVWPETATNIDQAMVLVEHTMMPYEEYDLFAQIGGCDPINVAVLTKPDWPIDMIERLSRAGLTPPSDVATGAYPDRDMEPIALVALTELWVRRGAIWEQSWLVWNLPGSPVVVRLREQPVAPYRMAVDRQLPGEHYTVPLMSDMEPLNVLFNDQINMGLESQATAAFAPTLIDPERVTRADSFVFRPRAKWLGEQGAVTPLAFPDTSSTSLSGAQMSMGLMDSFSGASALSNGTPTRGMPRAGFAVSTLISLSMSDITSMAELVEDEILTPLLGDLHRLTVGYPGFPGVPYAQMVSIPGAEGVTAWRGTVYQLLGAVSFRWVGTLQSQDQQVRAQRMLTLMGQFAKLYPAMKEQGVEINFELLAKRLWRDALGERGADSIIQRTALWAQFQQFLQMNGLGPDGQPLQPAQPGAPTPGGGQQAPAPATPEQGQRQDARGMVENGVGPMMNGLGVG